PVVPDPLLIELSFSSTQAPVHRFAPDLGSPLEVRPVRMWRISVATAVHLAAVVVARGHAARADEADLGELAENLSIALLVVAKTGCSSSGHRVHSPRAGHPPIVIR